MIPHCASLLQLKALSYSAQGGEQSTRLEPRLPPDRLSLLEALFLHLGEKSSRARGRCNRKNSYIHDDTGNIQFSNVHRLPAAVSCILVLQREAKAESLEKLQLIRAKKYTSEDYGIKLNAHLR